MTVLYGIDLFLENVLKTYTLTGVAGERRTSPLVPPTFSGGGLFRSLGGPFPLPEGLFRRFFAPLEF